MDHVIKHHHTQEQTVAQNGTLTKISLFQLKF